MTTKGLFRYPLTHTRKNTYTLVLTQIEIEGETLNEKKNKKERKNSTHKLTPINVPNGNPLYK